MNVKTLTRLVATGALTAGIAVAMTVPANAGNGVVVKSGTCLSASSQTASTWTLKAKPVGDQILVKAKVHSNVMGQNWLYDITKSHLTTTSGPTTHPTNHVVARGMISTQSSGSWTLRALTANEPGTSRISFRATKPGSTVGAREVCIGSVTI